MGKTSKTGSHYLWKIVHGILKFKKTFDYVGRERSIATSADSSCLLQRPIFKRFCRDNTFFVSIVPSWNALPLDVHQSQTLRSFKTHLRLISFTEDFSSLRFSFSTPLHVSCHIRFPKFYVCVVLLLSLGIFHFTFHIIVMPDGFRSFIFH